MTVEAKFTTAGMTKGKQYDVIEEKKCVNAYKIVLDDGTIAFRHRCGFKVVNENGRQVDIMRKIEITMEKTMRVAMEFDATEEQIEMLERGENPFWDEMEKELEHGNIEYDYAVVDVDTDEEIVPWN